VRHHYYINGVEVIRMLRKLDLPGPKPENLKRRLAKRQRMLPFRSLFDPVGHRRRMARILAARGMLDELDKGGPLPKASGPPGS
jgi:hypothetical protein